MSSAKKKFWSGQNYGQYRDTDGTYAGTEYDRHVSQGSPFPPSLNNHHFRRK